MAHTYGNQIQRPGAGIVNRTAGPFNTPGGGLSLWSQQQQQSQQHISPQNVLPVRQPFVASERSLDISERSNSAQEVEELLGSQGRMQRRTHYQSGWASTNQAQQQQQRGKSPYFFLAYVNPPGAFLNYTHTAFAPSSGRRTSGTFRPGGKGK